MVWSEVSHFHSISVSTGTLTGPSMVVIVICSPWFGVIACLTLICVYFCVRLEERLEPTQESQPISPFHVLIPPVLAELQPLGYLLVTVAKGELTF